METIIKTRIIEMTHFYEVDLCWKSERKGLMSSPVLESNIEVATPPEFPKGMPGIWSPEHLLVAAVNSCLMTTFLSIAENSRFNFIHFECKANGKLEKVEDRYMISEIELTPILTIADISERGKAEKILQKAELACLISNSVKSKILMRPEIRVQPNGIKNQ